MVKGGLVARVSTTPFNAAAYFANLASLCRALAKRVDLIFCPYNYILDPSIRGSMGSASFLLGVLCGCKCGRPNLVAGLFSSLYFNYFFLFFSWPPGRH